MTRVGIVGGSGFVGGELARWLLGHPHAELTQITSERQVGQPLHRVHPHLRGRSSLRFIAQQDLQACDLLFLALPHGTAAKHISRYEGIAERVLDCSADFRIRDVDAYARWYGEAHSDPVRNTRCVYGLPELHREQLKGARFVSGVGCNATAVQLALLPLARAGLLPTQESVVAQVLAGTSEGGVGPSAASHHPLRSGSIRAFAPTGHRHAAEVEQAYPKIKLHLTVNAGDFVRGAFAQCHVVLDQDQNERDLLRVWQQAAAEEAFVHVIHERAGFYRHPDPKLVTGTNLAQLGFALDRDHRRVVAMCAIDNLGKGAAGSAVQAMNLMLGWEETLGLDFCGIHPL